MLNESQGSRAIALLRAGCSYGEASDRTGLTLEDVISIWKSQDANPGAIREGEVNMASAPPQKPPKPPQPTGKRKGKNKK